MSGGPSSDGVTGFDTDAMAPRDRYKLMCGLAVPRPIALVTTVDPDGVVNAAPYSFYNVLSEEPPLLALGLGAKESRALKDTTENIRRTGAFVVNVVSEAIAEAMNLCAVDVPPEVDELALAGLTAVPSTRVAAPRIAEAPAAFECTRFAGIEVGPMRTIMLGRIERIVIRNDVLDAERLRIDNAALAPIGRLAGTGYCRTRDMFDLPRLTPEDLAR